PQLDSDVRNLWAALMGIVDVTNPPLCVHDHIVGTGTPGTLVREDDGTVFATDAQAFGPFSIAQWIGQKNHPFIDSRHNAVLHKIDNVSPLTPSGTLTTTFPTRREVYNVVLFTRLGMDPQFAAVMRPTLCGQSAQIIAYGFGLLPAPAPPLPPPGT